MYISTSVISASYGHRASHNLYLVCHTEEDSVLMSSVLVISHVWAGIGFLTKWFREMFLETCFAISRNKMGHFPFFAVSRRGRGQ